MYSPILGVQSTFHVFGVQSNFRYTVQRQVNFKYDVTCERQATLHVNVKHDITEQKQWQYFQLVKTQNLHWNNKTAKDSMKDNKEIRKVNTEAKTRY